MSHWNWKALIFCHMIIGILLTSFFWQETKIYWDMIDLSVFRFINNSLEGNQPWQIFWALANHKKADLFEDLCIFLFFFTWIRSSPPYAQVKHTAQFLFCILYVAFTILLVNHLIFRVCVEVFHASPTLALEHTIRLSKEIPWLSIKDSSPKSFPADHGTTALLFAWCYAFFSTRKRALIGILYASFLCMPRLITGAHWLSDVIVGSGSIAILFLSWAFYSPLHIYCTNYLEKLIYLYKKTKAIT